MKSFVTGGSGFLGRELIRALRAAGDDVVALARSERSAAKVEELGATPAPGDLDDIDALSSGMHGVDRVFHAAAHTEEWDSDENFHRVNVTGTENVLAAARTAGVRRLVHVSTEAVLADGKPIVRADERVPVPEGVLPGYPKTKALAEERVRAACTERLATVIIRPRFIWGRGDTAVLAKFVEGVHSGRLAWIDRGEYLTSTCHVANVCEGALAAAERGAPGETYFLTDGEPLEFRWFLVSLLRTQGLEAPERSVPHWLAAATARVAEPTWRKLRLKGTPIATRAAIALMGHEVTVVDAKARRDIGYAGKLSVDEGLAELARLPPVHIS